MEREQYLRELCETEGRPPLPEFATYAEPLLAVLRLGYVVEVAGEPSDSSDDSVTGAIAHLRSLGWPLVHILLKDDNGRPYANAYTLDSPYVPAWTWGLAIPVVRVAESLPPSHRGWRRWFSLV